MFTFEFDLTFLNTVIMRFLLLQSPEEIIWRRVGPQTTLVGLRRGIHGVRGQLALALQKQRVLPLVVVLLVLLLGEESLVTGVFLLL